MRSELRVLINSAVTCSLVKRRKVWDRIDREDIEQKLKCLGSGLALGVWAVVQPWVPWFPGTSRMLI